MDCTIFYDSVETETQDGLDGNTFLVMRLFEKGARVSVFITSKKEYDKLKEAIELIDRNKLI